MDAYEYYIAELYKYPKNHYRFLAYKKTIDSHISGLRLLALDKKGTNIAKFCNMEANRYQKLLDVAIITQDKRD